MNNVKNRSKFYEKIAFFCHHLAMNRLFRTFFSSWNLPIKWVNFIFLCKFRKETHCFLERFTQLETILHDHWSRQISGQCLIMWCERVCVASGVVEWFFELLICLKQSTPGPLCLWQCFFFWRNCSGGLRGSRPDNQSRLWLVQVPPPPQTPPILGKRMLLSLNSFLLHWT